MKKVAIWFKNLSRIAQVSVLSSVALGGLFMTSAMSPTPNSAPTAQIEAKKNPTITTKIETETQPIEFEKTTIEDSSLAKGSTAIRTAGANGIKTITHTITLTDGVETGRKTTESITTEPIAEVTALGTYVAPVVKPHASNCDSNYSGCVPIASDVDCAGGSGNGPAYAYGPIDVVGYDIYGLDRDGNGIACE
ncbi:MAG: G5 domain-containing protein [Candidatus Saccharimonadales bacterium]